MEYYFKLCFFIFCGVSFVRPFSWKSCGASTEPIKIISLDVFTNNTKTLYITGRGKMAINLTDDIQGIIDMQKKFFWGWTKIPCVDNVGSCTYKNLCELSPYIHQECPPDFVRNQLPCRCPILQGQYAAKKFPIDMNILPNWIEEGYYRIKVTLKSKKQELLCLLMYIQF